MICPYKEEECSYCESCSEYELNTIEVEIYRTHDTFVMFRYDIAKKKIYELISDNNIVYRLAGAPYELNDEIINRIASSYTFNDDVKYITSFQINI